jgi:urease accessory protein
VLLSEYRVESGASLWCEWDPVIPFPQARFNQQAVIDLDDAADLYWSDAMMSGREARGERWAFDCLSHELRVTQGRELRYLERYRLQPALHSPRRAWIADDACYFSTILSIGAAAQAGMPAELHAQLQHVAGVLAGVDRLDAATTLTRLTATSGVALRQARTLVGQSLRR